MDDVELVRRCLTGCGEMFAALGRSAAGPGAEVRQPDALGARLDPAVHHPFFSSAVVPPGARPPADDPGLPHYLWTTDDAPVPGRVEEPGSATPCMGLWLDDSAPEWEADGLRVETPSLAVLGEMNERAYDETGFAALAAALRDARFRAHGVRDGDGFACVAMTAEIGDDVGIYYVATEAAHRRRGLASRLVGALLADARARGARSSTLQASAAGLGVWRRLGYREVATMRGWVRPEGAA